MWERPQRCECKCETKLASVIGCSDAKAESSADDADRVQKSDQQVYVNAGCAKCNSNWAIYTRNVSGHVPSGPITITYERFLKQQHEEANKE